MIEWWDSLGIALQVFYCIAIPSTLVLLIQTILMFIGMDDDVGGTSDIGSEVDSSIAGDGIFGEDSITEVSDAWSLEGLRIFTVRGIISFFVVFGWVGVVMLSAGVPIWITIPVAIICGFGMMLLLAILLNLVMKLRSDGNTDNRNAIGTSGKVYLTIPPERTGEGKVYVMLQGSYVERAAVTDQTEAIPTGTEIVVVGVSGQTVLVVRRK